MLHLWAYVRVAANAGNHGNRANVSDIICFLDEPLIPAEPGVALAAISPALWELLRLFFPNMRVGESMPLRKYIANIPSGAFDKVREELLALPADFGHGIIPLGRPPSPACFATVSPTLYLGNISYESESPEDNHNLEISGETFSLLYILAPSYEEKRVFTRPSPLPSSLAQALYNLPTRSLRYLGR